MPTFHVENFGCRATQADGAALGRQFEGRGLSGAAIEEADIVLLNTCTVTAAADQDARAAVRRVQKQNPKARIIVTGCYAQRAPEEVAALPGVAAVIGNSHKHQLANLVLGREEIRRVTGGFVPVASLGGAEKARESGSALSVAEDSISDIFVSDIFAHTELLAAPVFEMGHGGIAGEQERTRPNLKVQDGCDNRCSFCIIPSVRGQSRSLPAARILRDVRTLVEAGYREVVISGINLGRWGRDLASGSEIRAAGLATDSSRLGFETDRFETLIQGILRETELEKLRISSVEPMDWSEELIELVASSPRIAKHAHVPLQSGSDAVLRRMHRKYRPWHYRDKIERIHAAMPRAAIGADVMTGFPGETDAEFECTRQMIEELPFTYLHVFTYSARPGTPAAGMAKQVPVQVARERNKILRELAAQKKQAFMQGFVGQQVEAITLNAAHPHQGEFTDALTDNYQKLSLRGRHAPNRWVRVVVEAVADGAFMAELVAAS